MTLKKSMLTRKSLHSSVIFDLSGTVGHTYVGKLRVELRRLHRVLQMCTGVCNATTRVR